jgi:shikimate kinase
MSDKFLDINKTIVLVGLMGCGKTSVGKLLAKALGRTFADTDHVIEANEGMKITQIFEQKGEEYFRELERAEIRKLLEGTPSVFATGGGAFMCEKTRELILAKSLCVWIHAEYDVLLERVSRKNHRPLLEKGDKAAILKELMDARYPIYAQAHVTVHSNNRPKGYVVDQILEKLESYE